MSSMVSHDEWQEQVVQLAHLYGWRHLHVRRTIGRGKKWTTSTNVKGWPDLFFWHPSRGGCFTAELKTLSSPDVRPEQTEVLAELRAAGIPSYVWMPADVDLARHAFDSLRGRHGLSLAAASLLARQAAALAEEGLRPAPGLVYTADADAALLQRAATVDLDADAALLQRAATVDLDADAAVLQRAATVDLDADAAVLAAAAAVLVTAGVDAHYLWDAGLVGDDVHPPCGLCETLRP